MAFGASCRLARQLLRPKQSQLTATIAPVAYVRVSTLHKVYLNCANFGGLLQVEISIGSLECVD
ncbi:hypothetical protein T01_16033 [Trichinella spiralis]|uniref:Uncharacterized protein n=1 Tax=Trichinella spiralis TaxID=6334 RepID=A0A0V1BDG3_TRISP|nr:hypothetical protein T01_16033 [Trichinella spiralis]